MIKNIIFDMGGVIFKFAPRVFVDRFDIPEEDKQIILDKIYLSYRWPMLDNGYYNNVDEFFEDAKKEIPQRLWDLAYEASNYWWKPEILPVEGTADLIRELKQKGYKIYLLSNAGPNHSEYWPYIPGHEYFDGLFISAVERMFKPDLDTFKACLKKFNLKAEECVFIDDLATNCAGACMVGINPIIFRNAKQLREELVSKKIL